MRPPEPLADHHVLVGFDCGKPDLNRWLMERGRSSEGRTARTYVVVADGRVVAFYCLAAGAVMREDLPRALRHNTPQPVPILVMGRLATDLAYRNRGYGKGLLKDAILRSLSAATIAGVLALVVHVIDDTAISFYKKYGFIQSPSNARTFILPLATARAAI